MLAREPHSKLIQKLIAVILVLECLATPAAHSAEKRVVLPLSSPGEVNRNIDAFLQQYKSLKPALERLVTVRLKVEPRLAKPGEEVTISIEAHADRMPARQIEIYPRYLEMPKGAPEIFTLHWEKREPQAGGHRYAATLRYTPRVAGNYLVHWKCDAGGDIREFWRPFGVVEDGYAVCTLEATGGNAAGHGPDPLMHKYHLPFKEWVNLYLFRDGWDAEAWAKISRPYRQFGDTPAMMIWVSDNGYIRHNPAYDPNRDGWQVILKRQPPEVQRLLLQRAREEVWAAYGFDGPATNLHHYCFTNENVALARELGYKTLGSLYAGQNWEDSTFPINHSGMPDRPYFIARDDYRKPGPGGRDAMVGIQQGHRVTALSIYYDVMYMLQPCTAFHPLFPNAKGRKTPDAIAISHILDFFDAMVLNRRAQKVPYVFDAGFEFGGLWPGAEEGNAAFIDYIVRQAASQPIVFSTGDAVSDYYRRHYTKTPETTCYLPDVFCGFVLNGKPACYPDMMQMEGPLFRSVHRRPEFLPFEQYDYTPRWNYPDFGGEGIPRDARNYLFIKPEDKYSAETPGKFKLTPKMIDTRAFKATRQEREAGGALEITFTLTAQAAQKNLALAVWDIPRAWEKGDGWFETRGGCRFVPLLAPFTDNLNGLLICNVRKGENRFAVRIKSPRQALRETALSLNGGQIQGRIFSRAGQSMAYLCSRSPKDETVRLTVPPGQTAHVYPAPEGNEIVWAAGRHELTLKPGQYARLTGLSGAEIQTSPDEKKTLNPEG